MQDQLRNFQQQIRRIEVAEERLELRVRRTRRRITECAMMAPVTRATHVRLYVHHGYTPELTKAGAMAALMQGRDVKPSPAIWTLQIEGKLLIDYLDAATEKHQPNKFDEEDAIDQRVQPVKFTHLFDKVAVTFQTIFETIPTKAPTPSKKKKSSRRSSTGASAKASTAATGVSQEDTQKILSTPQQLVFVRQDPARTAPPADMFTFEYPEPALPEPQNKWRVHSVVARAELYRRYQYRATPTAQPSPEDTRYRVLSTALQKALFPHHGPETVDMLTGKRRNFTVEAANGHPFATSQTIPTHNEVHIPSTLSMIEISNAFFTYIRDRRLVSAHDRSVVQADRLLQDVLGMEQFSFSQLQHLLLSKQLIVPILGGQVSEDPIRMTYLMDVTAANDKESVMQFDCDILAPNLSGARLRQLLRRVHQRAAQTTAISNNKPRSNLQNVKSDLLDDRSVPVHLAAGRTTDARIAYLMGQLRERVPHAAQARRMAAANKR